MIKIKYINLISYADDIPKWNRLPFQNGMYFFSENRFNITDNLEITIITDGFKAPSAFGTLLADCFC
jgi:hypothetical protein